MQVKISNYKSFMKGSLVGFCNIELPEIGMIITNCSLYQKGRARWVSWPSKKDEKEENKWWPYIRFSSKDEKDTFDLQVFTELDKMLQDNVTKAYAPPANDEDDMELPF